MGRELLRVGIVAFASSFPSIALAGSTAVGEHFQIICDFDHEVVAKASLEAAEAVWGPTLELFGAKSRAPKKPLKIHLYRRWESYRDVDEDLTAGKFKDGYSFSSHKDKSAHIVLQPLVSDDALRAIGCPEITRILVAHEAVHLAVYSAIPNHKAQPKWLREGLSMYVSLKTLQSKGMIAADEACPYTSTMQAQLQPMAAANNLPRFSDWSSGRNKEIDFYTLYSLQWQFFSFMMTGEREASMRAILAEARKTGEGSKASKALKKFISNTLVGDDDMASLDEAFRKHLEGLKPQWYQMGRSLEIRGNAWYQGAFPNYQAGILRMERPTERDFDIEGTAEFLPGTGKIDHIYVMLGEMNRDAIYVQFSAGNGVAAQRRYYTENRWDLLGREECEAVDHGKPFRFKASVRGEELHVYVNGKLVFYCTIGDYDTTGRWGVGAGEGSACIWRDMRLTPASAKTKGKSGQSGKTGQKSKK